MGILAGHAEFTGHSPACRFGSRRDKNHTSPQTGPWAAPTGSGSPPRRPSAPGPGNASLSRLWNSRASSPGHEPAICCRIRQEPQAPVSRRHPRRAAQSADRSGGGIALGAKPSTLWVGTTGHQNRSQSEPRPVYRRGTWTRVPSSNSSATATGGSKRPGHWSAASRPPSFAGQSWTTRRSLP